MNKINNIENEENKNTDELTESHFDEDGHNDLMDKIEEKKAEQKESDKKRAGEITENLFEEEKMPINDFIENKKREGNDNDNIVISLIKAGYKENEIINSSLKEWRKETKSETINFSFRTQSYRFNGEKEIDEKFFDIVKKSLDEGVSIDSVVKDIPLKRTITMEDINNLREKFKDNSDYIPSIKLSGEILPDLDWSQSREVFKYLAFDDKTFSQTSKEHLPEGYDPNEVFEKGKSIGLGIDEVHEMGYTGKGVGVAICDKQLKPHKDIKIKEYNAEKNSYKIPNDMHASAVGSILAGKQTGVAPDSDLYFFAKLKNNNEKAGGSDLKSAFTKILKKNQELPDDKKIRVVSISGPLFGEGIEDLVKQLEDSGVWVIHGNNFFKDFGYLEKKDPMGNPNDFENYHHCLGRHSQFLRKSDALFVNSGDRTVADPKDSIAYRHDTQASASWAIPVVAGYYALACQADPTMTPKKFKKLARETAHIIDSTIRNEKTGKRSTETREIKVIDIKALIQKIERLKYEKLLKVNPEQINLGDFIEDLNKGEGFRDDIKEKLKSNLIDSTSPDDIYREYSTSLKEMPFIAKVLNINDFEDKKELLNGVLQINNEISEKYFNREKMDELSNTLCEESVDYVLKNDELHGLAKGWNGLKSPLRLYIADKIVKNLSAKLGINPPYVININFGEQDLTMGSKGIINLNLNSGMFNNFYDFLAVLVHEFTHCLQDNYKTPGGEEGIKKAKQYYFNGISGDSRLNHLSKEVHDSSLLEKEAYYVQAKIKERALKEKF